MGTVYNRPNIEAVLDSASDTAFLRLHLDIIIPRQHFIELAALMDAERFNEAEALMLELRPETAEYLGMFFEKDLRSRSKSAPRSRAARVA